MIKVAVVCVICCALAYGRPQSNDPTPIPIVASYSSNSPDGGFNTTYETGNGIRVQSAGYVKRIHIPMHEDETGKVVQEHDEDIIVQVGSYSYPDNDGNVITLSYVADENGFQPTGDHLPKVPEPVQSEPFARAIGQPRQEQQEQQQQGGFLRQTRQQPQPFSRQSPDEGQF